MKFVKGLIILSLILTTYQQSEFIVNSYITNDQSYPSVATLTSSSVVIAWQSNGQDGNSNGVYARVFSSNGSPLTSEFRVNEFTTGSQYDPSVSVLSSNSFVITWTSVGQDGSDGGVYVRVFNSIGNPLTSEFRANVFTSGWQDWPSVAALSSTSFVVTWQSGNNQDGALYGIYARVFSSSGSALTSEFLVNTYTTNTQTAPSAVALSSSTFVITWTSEGQDGSLAGIYARVFSSNGSPQTGEFRVNVFTSNAQRDPSISALSSSRFVITWQSDGQDGSSHGIYARVFNSSGSALTSEFQVNVYATSAQTDPKISTLSSSSFIITWASEGQDGSLGGVYARAFSSSGSPLSSEFRVNNYTSSSQNWPAVSSLSSSSFVISWQSSGQDASGIGIYARVFGSYCLAGFYFNGISCTHCSAGSTSTDFMTTCTLCPAGQVSSIYQNIFVCTNCPAGRSSTAGSTSCFQCPTGQVSSSGGLCTTCTSGSIPRADQTGCTQCSAGTYQNVFVCSYCPAVCTNCPAGRSSTAGSTSCFQCPTGQVSSSGGLCTTCTSGSIPRADQTGCTQCSAGTYQNGLVCTNCPAGKFSSAGSTSCTQCPVGQISLSRSASCSTCQSGSIPKADQSGCDKCQAGSYQDGLECKTCPAGKFSESGSSTCTQCPAGTVSDVGSGSCSPCQSGSIPLEDQTGCLTCQAGTFLSSHQCIQCSAGTFSNAQGSTNCEPCPNNQVAAPGSSHCWICNPGFIPNENLSGCIMCENGFYRNGLQCQICPGGTFSDSPTDSCSQCQAGTYSQDGSAICTPCPTGKFSTDGSSVCRSCPDGSIINNYQTGCITCEAGTYSFNNQCEQCPEGTYSLAASSSCIPCPRGKTSIAGSSSCTNCPAGSVSNAGNTGCVTCQAGTFSSNNDCVQCQAGTYSTVGSSSCATCPEGQYSSNLGSISCTSCPAGSIPNADKSGCLECQAGTYSNTYECLQCPAGTYSSDGSSSCSPCLDGHYSIAGSSSCTSCPAGSISNNVHTSCVTCQAGTYTSNNICSQCPISTYSSEGSSSCTVCADGQYSSSIGSTICNSCTPGSISNSDNSGCLTCQAGTYSDNNLCASCPVGTYSVIGSSNCTSCPNGQYSSSEGSSSCNSCPVGSISNSAHSACITCQAGTFATNNECFQCQAGFYSAAGSTSCTSCQDGQYSAPGSDSCNNCAAGTISNTDHTACVTCQAGSYSSNNNCVQCPAGTFSSEGSIACTPCPEGETSNSGSSSCGVCPAGSAPSEDRSTCLTCRAGTRSYQNKCVQCPAGTYSVQGSSTCTTCSDGQFANIAGSTSCFACPSGTISNSDHSDCDACQAGTFSINNKCSKCPAGTYSSEGASSCTSCPNGQYSSEGSTSCSECEAGTISNNDHTDCLRCQAGTFSRYNQCQNCPAGSYSNTGASSCTTCPSGSIAQNVGMNSCNQCPGGTYESDHTSCLACPDGSISSVGSNQCQKCLPGTYSSNGISCQPCPGGTVATSSGSSACTPCPIGTIPSNDQTACESPKVVSWTGVLPENLVTYLRGYVNLKLAISQGDDSVYLNHFEFNQNSGLTAAQFTRTLSTFLHFPHGGASNALVPSALFIQLDKNFDSLVQLDEFKAEFPTLLDSWITNIKSVLIDRIVYILWGGESNWNNKIYLNKLNKLANHRAFTIKFSFDPAEGTNTHVQAYSKILETFRYMGRVENQLVFGWIVKLASCYPDYSSSAITFSQIDSALDELISHSIAFLQQLPGLQHSSLIFEDYTYQELSTSIGQVANRKKPENCFPNNLFNAHDTNQNDLLDQNELNQAIQSIFSSFMKSGDVNLNPLKLSSVYCWNCSTSSSSYNYATARPIVCQLINGAYEDLKSLLQQRMIEQLWLPTHTSSRLITPITRAKTILKTPVSAFRTTILKRFDANKDSVLNRDECTRAIQHFFSSLGVTISTLPVNQLVNQEYSCDAFFNSNNLEYLIHNTRVLVQNYMLANKTLISWNFWNVNFLLDFLNLYESIQESRFGAFGVVKDCLLPNGDKNKDGLLDLAEFRTSGVVKIDQCFVFRNRSSGFYNLFYGVWDSSLDGTLNSFELIDGLRAFIPISIEAIQLRIEDLYERNIWAKDSEASLISYFVQLTTQGDNSKAFVSDNFDKFDSNQDGSLTKTEMMNSLIAFFATLGKTLKPNELPHGLFDSWDDNLDDIISKDEYLNEWPNFIEDSIRGIQFWIADTCARIMARGTTSTELFSEFNYIKAKYTNRNGLSQVVNSLDQFFVGEDKLMSSDVFMNALTQELGPHVVSIPTSQCPNILFKAWDRSLDSKLSVSEFSSGYRAFILQLWRILGVNILNLKAQESNSVSDPTSKAVFNSYQNLIPFRNREFATEFVQEKAKELTPTPWRFNQFSNENIISFQDFGIITNEDKQLLYFACDYNFRDLASTGQVSYQLHRYSIFLTNQWKKSSLLKIYQESAKASTVSSLPNLIRQLQVIRAQGFTAYATSAFIATDVDTDGFIAREEFSSFYNFINQVIQLPSTQQWEDVLNHNIDKGFSGNISVPEFSEWIKGFYTASYSERIASSRRLFREELISQIQSANKRTQALTKLNSIKNARYTSYSSTLFKNADLSKNNLLDLTETRNLLDAFARDLGVNAVTSGYSDLMFRAWDVTFSDNLTTSELASGLRNLVNDLISLLS